MGIATYKRLSGSMQAIKYNPSMRGFKLTPSSLSIACLWAAFWLVPFYHYVPVPMLLRIGMGLAGMILPGAVLFRVLNEKRPALADQLTFGFSLSLIICGLLGLVAKTAHLSFAGFRAAFVAVGLVVIALGVWRAHAVTDLQPEQRKPGGLRSPALVYMIVGGCLAALITSARILTDDDTIYLAYIFDFQQSSALSFQEIIFGYDVASPARFWLQSIPISQAMVSSVSEVPAIVLLSGYYEPFLVGIALVAHYRLARALGLSAELSAAATLFQLAFLALLSDYVHPGHAFYYQLSADKSTAAFILTPVFLQSVVDWARRGGRSAAIICGMTGMSLSFAHPIILLFGCSIAAVLAFFAGQRGQARSRLIPIGAMLIAILTPHIAVRLLGGPSLSHYDASAIVQAGDADAMISTWGTTGLYGLNVDTLGMSFPFQAAVFTLPVVRLAWLWIPISAAVVLYAQRRSSPAVQYLLAALLLVVLTWIPLTGTLLGFVLTPWMLERAAWIFPYGITTALLIGLLGDAPIRSLAARGLNVTPQSAAIGSASLVCLGLIAMYMYARGAPDFDRLQQRALRYQDFVTVGGFLDAAGETVVLGSDRLNDLLPAVSAKAALMSYRPWDPTYSYFMDEEERRQRLADRREILAMGGDPSARLQLCSEYGIDFLIMHKNEFAAVEDLILAYPDKFARVFQSRYYVVVKVEAP